MAHWENKSLVGYLVQASEMIGTVESRAVAIPAGDWCPFFTGMVVAHSLLKTQPRRHQRESRSRDKGDECAGY